MVQSRWGLVGPWLLLAPRSSGAMGRCWLEDGECSGKRRMAGVFHGKKWETRQKWLKWWFKDVFRCIKLLQCIFNQKEVELKVSIFGDFSATRLPRSNHYNHRWIRGHHPQVVEILSRNRGPKETKDSPMFWWWHFLLFAKNTFKEPKRPFIKQFFETGIDFCCISWVLFWHWSKWTAGGTAGFWHFGGWFSSLAKCQSPCSGLRPPAETLWCRCSWWLWSFHL